MPAFGKISILGDLSGLDKFEKQRSTWEIFFIDSKSSQV